MSETTLKDVNSSVFTEDELEVLDLAKKTRLDIVKNMTKEKVPDKTNEIRVLNELLSGLEKSVQDSASNRLKHQEGKKQEAIAENVSELLKQLSNQRQTEHLRTTVILDDLYLPNDLVPGETDITPVQLEINQFINEENN